MHGGLCDSVKPMDCDRLSVPCELEFDTVSLELPDYTVANQDTLEWEYTPGLGTFHTRRDVVRGKKSVVLPFPATSSLKGAHDSNVWCLDSDWGVSVKLLTTQLRSPYTFQEPLRKKMSFTLDAARELRFWKSLKSHQGCVNRLCWRDDGSVLASVSDDLHLCLWNIYNRNYDEGSSLRPVADITTGHESNIFGVCFVTDDAIATGAMDGTVRLTHVSPCGTSTAARPFLCHADRVKQLVSVSHSVWLSCSEDGTVRRYDEREPHDCTPGGCQNAIVTVSVPISARGRRVRREQTEARDQFAETPVTPNLLAAASWASALIPALHSTEFGVRRTICYGYSPLRNQIKSIAVHPIRKEYILVGGSDPIVRLYDSRMLSMTTGTSIHDKSAICETYCPLSLWRNPLHMEEFGFGVSTDLCHPSYVAWRPDGKEFLATYSGDMVYVFPFQPCRTDDTAGCALEICCPPGVTRTPQHPAEKPTRSPVPSEDLAVTRNMEDAEPSDSEPAPSGSGGQTPAQSTDDERFLSFLLGSLYPHYISDALFTVIEPPEPSGLDCSAQHHTQNQHVYNDGRDSDHDTFFTGDHSITSTTQHPFEPLIRKVQSLGNAYMAKLQYQNAIAAYTAALHLAGPAWPVHKKSPRDPSVTSKHDKGAAGTLVIDARITALRLPLLCNRSLALSKRNERGDCYHAEVDAIEALSYDPSNIKAVYRLLQAQTAGCTVANAGGRRNTLNVLVGLYRSMVAVALYAKSGSALRVPYKWLMETAQRTGAIDRGMGDELRQLVQKNDWITAMKRLREVFAKRAIPTPVTFEPHPLLRRHYLVSLPACVATPASSITPRRRLRRRFDSPEQAVAERREATTPVHIGTRSLPRTPDDSESTDSSSEDQEDPFSCDVDMERLQFLDLSVASRPTRLWPPKGVADRFTGRQHLLTDIQEATFWGREAIVSACNSGAVHIWRRSDGALLRRLVAPYRLGLNCVQVHPELPIIASSGLDDHITLWQPPSAKFTRQSLPSSAHNETDV